MRFFLAFSLLFMPSLGFSDPSVPATVPAPAVFDPLTSSYLIKLVVSLMFVLALMFAVIWLLKRAGQFTGVMGRYPMTVLAQMSVGSRERVLLIEVGDRQLLIGVSQGHIEALGWLDPPLAPQAAGALAGSGRMSFAQLLARQSFNRTVSASESKPSPAPESNPAAARDAGAA